MRESGLDISQIALELKEEIERKRALVVEWNHQGVKGSLQISLFTQMVDTILRRLFHALFKQGYADYSIVALGGYGRKEMGLYSDVDIMFLYTGRGFNREEQVGTIVQTLWDMGLHVGHSYRSVNEAIKLMKEDSTIRMSFLDARLIGGSLNPYLRFKNMLPGGLKGKKKQEFLKELMGWLEERHDKFGASMYLLEPNVKESPGGLRDVHTMLWAAKAVYGSSTIRDLKRKGLLTPLEFEILSNSVDFLWRVRNEIHARRERKSDTLSLDIQEFAAEHLGYRSTRRLIAVELFMRDYYASVASIRRIARAFLLRTMEEMRLTPFREGEVKTLLEVLERRYNAPEEFLEDVHRLQLQGMNFEVIPKSFWIPPLSWREEDYKSPKVRDALNRILSSKNAYSTLRFLHEVGFLGRIFPLWERLRGLMQFDIYHRYTVDEHSLLSIRFYEELEDDHPENPELFEVCNSIPKEKRHLTILALLLHDIGKGRGGGHSVRGARIATEMLQALGYPEDEIEIVQFLVRHHTTLYQTALRRDPTDPNSLKELANICETPLMLDLLLLVTYGDLKAVGPDVWTDWKANIILETYQRTRDYLERGEEALSRPEEKRGVEELSLRLEKKLKGSFTREEIAKVLSQMPEKYLAQVSIRHMAVHIPPMIKARVSKGYSINFAPHPEEGYTEMALCKRDLVGDFANIVGVLSLNRVNVLSAWLFLCSDDYALDVFHITDSRFRYEIGERTIKKIQEDLGAVFSGETTIEELLKKKKPSLLSQKYSNLKVPTKITLDNDTSHTHSIIDIKALDRIGLLYDIASTLTNEGLSIEATRITTEGNKAVDAFYVVDSTGSKLSHARFLKLSKKLKQAIEHGD